MIIDAFDSIEIYLNMFCAKSQIFNYNVHGLDCKVKITPCSWRCSSRVLKCMCEILALPQSHARKIISLEAKPIAT